MAIDEKMLIERLEEFYDENEFEPNSGFIETCLEIVKDLAEEHNNGWIPCEVRLPNKEEYLKYDGRFLVTDGNRVYQSYYDIYDEMFVRSWFASEFKKDKCVIAWQTLPAPYKKGE